MNLALRPSEAGHRPARLPDRLRQRVRHRGDRRRAARSARTRRSGRRSGSTPSSSPAPPSPRRARRARRSWLYRIRPSAGTRRSAASTTACSAARSPTPTSEPAALGPAAVAGRADRFRRRPGHDRRQWRAGRAVAASRVHVYRANRSMQRVFFNADGELLIVPQLGRLRIATECGRLDVAPREIAVLPRGMKFRVELLDDAARGYVAREPRRAAAAARSRADRRQRPCQSARFPGAGRLVRGPRRADRAGAEIPGHAVGDRRSTIRRSTWSPGTATIRRTNTTCLRFNTISTVSFDHPDPSIFTVLTSPTAMPGVANVDFVIFPPRWMVAEHTFRPPWFHRNVMNEFMGLVNGAYDAKAGGFAPGGMSLHSCMSAHGPDAAATERAMSAELAPHKIDNTLAFMFETGLRAPAHRVRDGAAPQLQGGLRCLLGRHSEDASRRPVMIDATHDPSRRSWVALRQRPCRFPDPEPAVRRVQPGGRRAARRRRDRRRYSRSRGGLRRRAVLRARARRGGSGVPARR